MPDWMKSIFNIRPIPKNTLDGLPQPMQRRGQTAGVLYIRYDYKKYAVSFGDGAVWNGRQSVG